MTPKKPSPSAAWQTLNLLEDWLTTGFSREHPQLAEAEPFPAGAGSAPFESPIEPPPGSADQDRAAQLAAVAAEVSACMKCALAVSRTTTVPGEGALDPLVLFVGEGPGAEEDRTGRPFVGAAGQYLDTWLPAIGLNRGQCYIANCVKCRPPQNREPHPDERSACLPFLFRQIDALRPRIVCCLGRIAAQTLLGTTASVSELRGRMHQHRGIPVVVTYHPSAVLRDKAALRKPVWEDLKLLKGMLGT